MINKRILFCLVLSVSMILTSCGHIYRETSGPPYNDGGIVGSGNKDDCTDPDNVFEQKCNQDGY